MFKKRREQRDLEARAALVEQRRAELAQAEESRRWAGLPVSTSTVQGVILKSDETAFLRVDGVAYIEPRRTPGKWTGGSSGVSVRVAKGLSYRAGRSKGTFVQGAEVPTPVDRGAFVVTNRRCIFVGEKRTTEWVYAKLVGFSLDGDGVAYFNVSNRQKTTGVYFGTELETRVDATIAGAIARFQGPAQHAAVVAEFDQAVAEARSAVAEVALPPPSVT